MASYDFDAARRATEPVTFTAFGREWTLAPLPSVLVSDFLIVTEISRQRQLADAIVDVFVTDLDTWRPLVAQGQPAAPARRAAKNRKAEPAREAYDPLSYPDKKDLILWACRQEAGRPIGRFANS
jgi:hypothetical protein